MNTVLLLNKIYNNFINNKKNNLSNSNNNLNNIKEIEYILKDIDIKCENIVDDLLKDRNNFEKNNFKYIEKS